MGSVIDVITQALQLRPPALALISSISLVTTTFSYIRFYLVYDEDITLCAQARGGLDVTEY